MTVSSHELEKKIYDEFSDVLDWHYNNRKKDSVVIIFNDGSEAVYTVDKIMKDEVNKTKESCGKKKSNIFESLTEQDIEDLSEMSLTESEIQDILSLFELISEENKDRAFAIIKKIFKNKKLVPDTETSENFNKKSHRLSTSERYTRTLLGDK